VEVNADYLESHEELNRERSAALLNTHLDYCQHLGLPAIIMDLPDCESPNFSRAINSKLVAGINTAVSSILSWGDV